MQQLGISAQVKPSRKPTTKSDLHARFAPHHLNREFSAQEPNTRWVSDTKAVETAEGWLYLAVILDLFSRMVVGWAMAATEDSELVELADAAWLSHSGIRQLGFSLILIAAVS
jgi:putative transposase